MCDDAHIDIYVAMIATSNIDVIYYHLLTAKTPA